MGETTTRIALEVCVPQVPNFVRLKATADVTIDVATLTDKALRDIGREWTANLLANAKKRRAHR